MNKSIEKLMSEHRLIEQVLGSLATFLEKLGANPDLPREHLAQFAGFFRNFADRCHHGKEEDRLFAKMNVFGFPREFGPISVMLLEHSAGRCQVRALAEIGASQGPLTAWEITQAREHGDEFITLLLGHIQKEDQILYPMAQQAIPAHEFDQLDAACETFEREEIGSSEIAKWTALAGALIAIYPPDTDRIRAGAACTGCHGHS